MTRTIVSLSLASTLLLAACASTPPAPAPAPGGDCLQLTTSIASAQDERRAAVEKRDGSWKAVVPFVVLGRYASGSKEVDEADARLGSLTARAAENGCRL